MQPTVDDPGNVCLDALKDIANLRYQSYYPAHVGEKSVDISAHSSFIKVALSCHAMNSQFKIFHIIIFI